MERAIRRRSPRRQRASPGGAEAPARSGRPHDFRIIFDRHKYRRSEEIYQVRRAPALKIMQYTRRPPRPRRAFRARPRGRAGKDVFQTEKLFRANGPKRRKRLPRGARGRKKRFTAFVPPAKNFFPARGVRAGGAEANVADSSRKRFVPPGFFPARAPPGGPRLPTHPERSAPARLPRENAPEHRADPVPPFPSTPVAAPPRECFPFRPVLSPLVSGGAAGLSRLFKNFLSGARSPPPGARFPRNGRAETSFAREPPL